MRKTLVLSSALALLMGSGMAFAGDNNTLYIEQQGTGNVQFVQQGATDNNDTGLPGAPILQNGDNNSFL